MKQFKYKIFDLDGTLLDSMGAWRDLGKDYLLQKGINPPDNLNEIIAAMSMLESAAYFQEAFKIELSAEEIIKEVKMFIEYKYRHEFKLKPYVKEYLEKLENENTVMCIATATPLKLAKAALERNEIIDYFSFVISCDEVGVGKNNPDIFILAANKLNAKPSEIAVYEDADFALITAKEEGFYTIGVYDDYFKNERKDIELISDIYIESFKELL
ncbi:MAG: HAD family phosphatase [Tissierellia bacterium]|nr:HAD family phosphatase [Tissierellia bacterium]MDD3750477.1 HAD family phosphatase [Tissierellia bacterium]MDD4047141.1 HAD family phosphatase [Tissierellia bacterium]MDD4679203.1 HAD family phosphatase [Tissierellia bacterium]